MKERPIIMTAESVRAILDGRKTQTRRVMRETKDTKPLLVGGWAEYNYQYPDRYLADSCPYGVPGDRLWVRETWRYADNLIDGYDRDPPYYLQFLADGSIYQIDGFEGNESISLWEKAGDWNTSRRFGKWRPSIHMPRWASRITLEITGVRVERLTDISEEDAKAEGVEYLFSQQDCDTVVGIIGTKPEDHGYKNYLWHGCYGSYGLGNKQSDSWSYQYSGYKDAAGSYSSLWEKLNSKRGYPWDSNPWVWVIEFERVDK